MQNDKTDITKKKNDIYHDIGNYYKEMLVEIDG